MKIIKAILFSISMLGVLMQANAQTKANPVLNNVITAYFGVKNGLVADNNATARSKSKELNEQVVAVSTKNLSPAQQTVWKAYVDKLSFDSRHISESTDIAHQREHFAAMSKNMYEVLKAFKINTMPIYWQYCPMKKQSWLSETAAIKNPYYGSEMEDCGSVKETLKAVK